MAKLVFDKAKMIELGDGTIKGFCENYNIKRNNLYRMENTSRKEKGTYAHEVSKKLIALGVAKWVNENEEKNTKQEETVA